MLIDALCKAALFVVVSIDTLLEAVFVLIDGLLKVVFSDALFNAVFLFIDALLQAALFAVVFIDTLLEAVFVLINVDRSFRPGTIYRSQTLVTKVCAQSCKALRAIFGLDPSSSLMVVIALLGTGSPGRSYHGLRVVLAPLLVRGKILC